MSLLRDPLHDGTRATSRGPGGSGGLGSLLTTLFTYEFGSGADMQVTPSGIWSWSGGEPYVGDEFDESVEAGQTISLAVMNPQEVTVLRIDGCDLIGELFDIAGALPFVVTFDAANNQLSGAMPVIVGMPNLQDINLSNNPLTGSLPEPPPSILNYRMSSLDVTGDIPTFEGAANISQIEVDTNLGLTGFAGAFSETAVVPNFYASGCALTEAAVDNLLSALAALSSGTATIDLTGGTNAPPSPVGLAAKAGLEALGCTVNVNEPAEFISNGAFATDTLWVTPGGWTIVGGVASCAGGTNNLEQEFGLLKGTTTVGRDYVFSFTLTNSFSDTVVVELFGDVSNDVVFSSDVGSGPISIPFTATSVNHTIIIHTTNGDPITVDDVSLVPAP